MNPNHVDLVSLRVFVAVAQSGSISAGATMANLSIAAVSKRVAELEALTGSSLFQRLPTGVQLTLAGHALLHHALQVQQAVERMTSDLDDFAQGLAGQVRILTTSSAVVQGLPEQLKAFSVAYPSIKIDLEERLSSEVVRYVLERKADIGIFTNNVPYDGLTVQPYGADEMVLIAASSHPIAKRETMHLKEALQYGFIAQHDSTAMNNVLAQAAAEAGIPLKLRSLMRSYDGVCRMVAADIGLGLVPASFTIPSNIVTKLHVVRLEDPWAQRQLLTGVRDIETLPAAVKVLRNHLRNK